MYIMQYVYYAICILCDMYIMRHVYYALCILCNIYIMHTPLKYLLVALDLTTNYFAKFII